MLNLNCVICADLFGASDDVHVTNCGHLFHFACINQWLERSKTCPQCRNKCTNRSIVRVYFNLANLDVSRIDVGSLQDQLDNVSLQLSLKEKELSKSEAEIKKLKETQKKSMKTISGLEEQVKKKDFVIYSYIEQVKILKSDAHLIDSLREEVKSLKNQIETMEGVSSILTSTRVEAEKLLKTENDPKKLALWVTTLKRELRTCESKKTDLRSVLKVVQKQLQFETEQKKALQERLTHMESDCYQLMQKLEALESNKPGSFTVTNSTTESPSTLATTLTREERRQTISPNTREAVKKIQESNSPYFNLKSSSIGLGPFLKRSQDSLSGKVNGVTTAKLATLKISPKKSEQSSRHTGTLTHLGAIRKTSSDLSEKYSIFKKPRLGLSGSLRKSTTSSNYVINAFGAPEKLDPFVAKYDEEQENDRTSRKTSTSLAGLNKHLMSSVHGLNKNKL